MNVKPLVEMKGIRKNFGAVQALKGVDLTLHHNEVLGLVGDMLLAGDRVAEEHFLLILAVMNRRGEVVYYSVSELHI